ncbi:MAG: hypothetical protein ABWX96_07715 [Propionibacteriaceae bacterium]
MSENNEVERPLDRRLLLRGGAILAGAAGVTAIGAAMGPTAAHAADGDTAMLGELNETSTSTTLAIGGSTGSSLPALTVVNASGPVLKLSPVGDGYSGQLKLGELAVTTEGPEIGVYGGPGGTARTTWLATGLDLDQIPITLPIDPERLLDTRTSKGRESIRSTSTNALNSSGQLTAGSWMDIGIVESDFIGLRAVFLNVTVVAPTANGYITAYPPGERPGTSTINFVKKVTLANGTFILVDVAEEDEDWVVVRIFSTATTHVILDLTGVSLYGVSGERAAAAGTASQRKALKSNRMARTLPGR